MEDEAHTCALPYLERLAQGLSTFSVSYTFFVDTFTKCLAPHNSAEIAQDVLKHLKQGKSYVAEDMAKFDQFTTQMGWSNADHCTRFYNGLRDDLKGYLVTMDFPIGIFAEVHTEALQQS